MKIYVYDSDSLLNSEFAPAITRCLSLMRGTTVDLKKYVEEVTDGEYYFLMDNSDKGDICVGCMRYSTIDKKLANMLRLNKTSSVIKLVSSVFIRKEYRKNGNAKRIMKAVSTARPKLLLEVLYDNTPALKLYFKSGFRPIDQRKLKDTYIVLMSTCETCIRYKK